MYRRVSTDRDFFGGQAAQTTCWNFISLLRRCIRTLPWPAQHTVLRDICQPLSMLQRSLWRKRLIQRGGLLRVQAGSLNVPRPAWSAQGCGRTWPERTALRRQLFNSFAAQSVGDTIYALSTAQGRAGIAVVRISGPACLEVSTRNRSPWSSFQTKSPPDLQSLVPGQSIAEAEIRLCPNTPPPQRAVYGPRLGSVTTLFPRDPNRDRRRRP